MEWWKLKILQLCFVENDFMKNICFAYITPFHPERGGIGRVTHILTLELLRRGYNVFYLIFCSGITIKYVYDYPVPLTYLSSSDKSISDETIIEYQQYLYNNKIDVVINQSGNFDDSQLWVNTGNSKIKVISVLHSNPWVAYKHLWSSDIYPLKSDDKIEKLKRIARILLYPQIKYRFWKSRKEQFKELLPKTDVVCMLSEKYFSELTEICPGFEEKYCAIPNPNSYSELELQRTNTPKKKQLLFVGLFGPPKREDRLVILWKRMFKDYPDWELIIVGDGERKRVERLKRMSSGIPNIRFEGFQNPLPYQQEASIFCMTSNYEGWGMVLTEAMQCGTVPIAFDSFASITDIIENGSNGILIPSFQIKEYEYQLRKLMDDVELLRKMSAHAKEDIKKYSVENVISLWEKIL